MSERTGAARRPAPRAAARGSSTGAARPSAFIRGNQGRSRTDEELQHAKDKQEQRRAQANKPFRLYVPVGETRQFIVCDDAPDFFLYEHALKDAEGRWGRLFSGCIKEFATCPVCRVAERESYYAMALTVVDLTPFDTRDGDTVDFSRKLLIVKPQQQKKFLRFYQKEGTLRGALFATTRDGDKDATIGNDIEFLEFVSEDEMATYVRSWKDREGKKHTEVCSEPFVYEEVFDEPTEESLLALVGGDPVPGSRAANERELGARRGTSSRGGSTERPARRGAKEDDWEGADDSRRFGRGRAAGPDDADDAPPARPARRGRNTEDVQDVESRPARRGRAAEPDDNDDAPPPRRAARRSAEPDDAGDAPPPRRRAAPEPADDDPPPRRTARRTAEPDDTPPPRRGRGAPEPADDDPPPRRGHAAPPEDDAPPPRRGRAAPPEDDAPPPRRGRAAAPAPRAAQGFDDMDDDIPF